MRCAICGEIVENIISRDHVFPRAIWKWQETTLPKEEFTELKRAIESSKNIVKVHPDCNYAKEESLFNIDDLTLTEKQRRKLEVVEKSVRPYIAGYMQIKEQIISRQNEKCYVCKKALGEDRVLRRIDTSKPRTIENGCVLCHNCNRNTAKLTC